MGFFVGAEAGPGYGKQAGMLESAVILYSPLDFDIVHLYSMARMGQVRRWSFFCGNPPSSRL